MKKSLLTLGVLAFAGITMFTSCKDEDGSYTPATLTPEEIAKIDKDNQDNLEAGKAEAAGKAADESKNGAITAATETVGQGETGDYGVADDNVSAPTVNEDGSSTTTQNFTDNDEGTKTVVTTTTKDNSDGSTTVTKTAETTDAVKGTPTSTTETVTEIKTEEIEGSLPSTISETTVTVTTYDEDGNPEGEPEVKTSTTTTTYQYTYEVDGVTYKNEQDMLAALSSKTTTATVVITLVETTTTVGFDGKVTTTYRTSTQITQVPAPQGTQPTTTTVNLPTTMNIDSNGVSVTSGQVQITIVPTKQEEPEPHTHGGGGAQG